jgi:M6 family metalloprotease-like protein
MKLDRGTILVTSKLRSAAIASLVLVFVAGNITPALAAKRFPRPIDPQSWVVPEDMKWSDYKPIPGVDWKEVEGTRTLRAALILGDFQDQKFRVAETTTDPTGQTGLGVDDPAQYWVDLLFKDTNPNNPQHGHTVGEYWLENSYGLIGVDAEAFGPYTMAGNMYEYGATDFGDGSDCPDDSGCSGDFDSEVVAASAPDVAAAQQEHGEFDFRFLIHAGYDESGVWLNFGQAMFETKEDVTDEFGPAEPDHRNWATTRYVDWTSFFSAQNIWSHALPGLIATEGESDGGSVYAHELSHVLGILDNYNNPYEENPDRAYAGPWDMMDRGTFNGPGGPFERYTIPPTQGATMGAHHMLRNKIRLGFTPPSEVLTITRDALKASGPITTRILQRESPPDTTDTELNSGLRIILGQDLSSCDSNDGKCDGGNYDFYDLEVVNRQGFDSFIPDHGVLIAKSKAADASPYIWTIDSHLKDLKKVDYVRADGEKFYYTLGDYRQLADAAFHAGTGKKVVNSYVDEANELAFFVLDKQKVDGRLVYDVAAQALGVPNLATATVEKKSGSIEKRKVTKLVFDVTNDGTQAGIFRLGLAKKGKVKAKLLNDLLYLGVGETKSVTVWVRGGRGKPKVNLEANPAVES